MQKRRLYHNYSYGGPLIYTLRIITHYFSHRNRACSRLSRGMPRAATPRGCLRRSLHQCWYTACFPPPLRAASSSAPSLSASLWSLSQRTLHATLPGWPRPRGVLYVNAGRATGLWGSPRCGRAPLVLTAFRAFLCCRGVRRLVVVGGEGGLVIRAFDKLPLSLSRVRRRCLVLVGFVVLGC